MTILEFAPNGTGPAQHDPVDAAQRSRRAEAIHAGLRQGGVRACVSLPDSVLNPLTRLLEHDPEVLATRCQREDEGLAHAAGMSLGGRMPVALMEGSGIGLSGLILARMQICRIPVLILASHSKLYGEEHDYHLASAHVAEGVPRGLDIPYDVLTPDRDLTWMVHAVLKTCASSQTPRALLLPPGIV